MAIGDNGDITVLVVSFVAGALKREKGIAIIRLLVVMEIHVWDQANSPRVVTRMLAPVIYDL